MFWDLIYRGQLTFVTDNGQITEQGYTCVGWTELEKYLASLKGQSIAYDPTSLPVAVHGYLLSWREPRC